MARWRVTTAPAEPSKMTTNAQHLRFVGKGLMMAGHAPPQRVALWEGGTPPALTVPSLRGLRTIYFLFFSPEQHLFSLFAKNAKNAREMIQNFKRFLVFRCLVFFAGLVTNDHLHPKRVPHKGSTRSDGAFWVGGRLMV